MIMEQYVRTYIPGHLGELDHTYYVTSSYILEQYTYGAILILTEHHLRTSMCNTEQYLYLRNNTYAHTSRALKDNFYLFLVGFLGAFYFGKSLYRWQHFKAISASIVRADLVY